MGWPQGITRQTQPTNRRRRHGQETFHGRCQKRRQTCHPLEGIHAGRRVVTVYGGGGAVAAAQLLWASATPEPAVSDALSAVPLPANGEVLSNAPAGDNSAQTLNLYGGGMRPLVEERDGVQTLNIYGPGGRIIAQVVQDGQGSEEVRYLLTDHLGSTRVVLDAEGNAVARYEYAPHGETTIAGTAAAEVKYRYTGHPYDEGQEVYQSPARGYDPTLGRFLSVDPQRQDASPYVYAGNNPVGYVDPTGGTKVPYFMKSTGGMDTQAELQVRRSIGKLFDLHESQRIADKRAFTKPAFDPRDPHAIRRSSANSSPKAFLRGAPGAKKKFSYDERFFWIIENVHETIPDDFYDTLDRIHTVDGGFGTKIVLLDFTGSRTGFAIQSELYRNGITAALVKAQYVTGRDSGRVEVATGFRYGGHEHSPQEFQAYVEQQMRITWQDDLPSSSAAPITQSPVTTTSVTTTSSSEAIAGPSGMTAGQKHSLEPSGETVEPASKRSETLPPEFWERYWGPRPSPDLP